MLQWYRWMVVVGGDAGNGWANGDGGDDGGCCLVVLVMGMCES